MRASLAPPLTTPMTSSTVNPFMGAQFLLSAARLAQLPQDQRPELAFAGRSNAGKSSALNRLCGHNALARVSKTPGRTQLLNVFDVALGRLIDLPGYGFAKVSKGQRQSWGVLIGDYLERRSNLCAIVLIVDIRHPQMEADQQMLEWAIHRDLPCHVLLTKADKLGFGASKNTLLAMRRSLPENAAVSVQLFSSASGAGVEECRQRCAELLLAGQPPHDDAGI